MIAVDTSVVIAAVSVWHEHHALAAEACRDRPHLPAHCLLEAYSTMTRLPDPFRAPAGATVEVLEARFGDHVLTPHAATVSGLPRRLAELGLSGGSTYDALVAVTARDHHATLLSLDRRALATYRAVGVDHRMLL